MDEYKISQTEIDTNNVKSAADLLKGDPKDNKNVFDRLPELIAARFNRFVEHVIDVFTDYYTKEEADEKETAFEEILATKADADKVYEKTETYTKTETDEALGKVVSDMGEYINAVRGIYDKDSTGVVDDAEKLGGQQPEYYATAEDMGKAKEDIQAIKEAPGAVIVNGVFTSYDEENGIEGTVELTANEIMAHINNGENVVLLLKGESGKYDSIMIAQYDGYSTDLWYSLAGGDAVACFESYNFTGRKKTTLAVRGEGILSGSISSLEFVPKPTIEDRGKFLRVGTTLQPEWKAVESAEGVSF